MTTEVTVIRCPDCGGSREISVRQRRRIRNASVSELCPICRTIPSEALVAEKDKQFWLKPYKDATFSRPACSMEWIRETASMIWGE